MPSQPELEVAYEDDDDFGSLGSLSGSSLGGSRDLDSELTSLADRVLGDDVLDAPPGAAGRQVQPPESQPCNQATMVCLRGPCQHYWTLTSCFTSQNGKVRPAVARQCNYFEGAETSLGEQNVYSCGAWWPSWAVFVPESLRPVLRPYLVQAWERVLKLRGYDFDWRWWEATAFEQDTPEERKHGGPGKGPASYARNRSSNGTARGSVTGGMGAQMPAE